MSAIDVFVRFLGGGFKYPLRSGDTLEIWSNRHELCGTIDAAMLLDLLMVFLRTADLTKRLADAVETPPAVERALFHLAPPEERRPLADPIPARPVPTREQKEANRARRRARRQAP